MELDILFNAKSFAVVGTSIDPSKVGHQILKNLSSNKNLTLYPINLKGGNILGYQVYPHLAKTPTVPDVVVISVPASSTADVIDECISINTKAVILISSGFAEMGSAGATLQSAIAHKLKNAGIILLGPNSMGYMSPSRGIDASFGPPQINSGSIALISQSGAMLSALFAEYDSVSTGVSFALSLGNKIGITENDALSYALKDDQTKVIVIYLESLADPTQLLSLSSAISIHKPIYLLKGGTTETVHKAAVSHTASLATSEVLLTHLCRQAGIVQVANLEQLVRASSCSALAHYLPENIVIITNAGGPSVVLTDEIVQAGIPLSSPPLDLLGDATPADFERSLSEYCGSLSTDAVVVIVTEQSVTDMEGITKVLSRKRGKHLLFVCLAGGDELEIYRTQLKQAGVIVTRYPNEIAETLGLLRLAKLAQTRQEKPPQVRPDPDKPYPVSYLDTIKLIENCGFKTPLSKIIKSESELNTLSSLCYPLIAKTTNLEIKHKGKIGAVIQDIIDEPSANSAYQKLLTWGSDVVYQEKIKEGIEVLLGAQHDPIWGWYIAVGLGGSLSDTYDDRAYILLPAGKEYLKTALTRTKLSSLLNPDQTTRLVAGILQFQDIVLSTSNLTELEINPLFITSTQLIAADLKRS